MGRLHVVHSHTTKSDFVAAGTAALTRAVRVSTRHITAARGWSPPARLAARYVRRTLDVEIAVSAFTASALPEGRPDEVLLNGVPSVADEVGGRHVQRADVVVLAQRLTPEKGTDVALRAFAASGLASRGWKLHVAGDGSERPRLQALVHELGLNEQVRFLGWVDDVDTLYRQASIMLAPAPAEPLGLSVLEAAARGLPVLVSAAAGHLETIGTSLHARTFPVGDHTAAARQLCDLADDPEERRRYGRELQELQRSTFQPRAPRREAGEHLRTGPRGSRSELT